MNTLCKTRNLFAFMSPDMPLRIEVMNAIYFGAQNLHTYHTILPRIEFGLKISCVLDGYWRKDKRGRICRIASLENGLALTSTGEYLEVFIDLQHKTFQEVESLYLSIVKENDIFGHRYALP